MEQRVATAAERVFKLSVPRPDAESLLVPLEHGETLFVVGANGAGKSSLLHHLAHQEPLVKHIPAYRPTALPGSSVVSLTAESRAQQKRRAEFGADYRWQSPFGIARRPDAANDMVKGTLFDLANHEHMRAMAIASNVDENNYEMAWRTSTEDPSVIDQINAIFAAAQFGVAISLSKGDRFVAHRPDGSPFDMEQMSDGERAAALLAAEMITADTGLLLIEEPERHLHRSITVPLLRTLFATRNDCAFVIATHDVDLPVALGGQTILLSECTFTADGKPAAWTADLVPSGNSLSEEVKRDILGARRDILFVEGEGASLDYALYSALFPEFTVIPKGGFKEVQSAVHGIRSTKGLNWLRAFGIVDHDLRSDDDISELRSTGIYALPVSAVESVYYHPMVQRLVAPQIAETYGASADDKLAAARGAALKEFQSRSVLEGWVSLRVHQKVRRDVLKSIPEQRHIEKGVPGFDPAEVSRLMEQERKKLDDLIQCEDVDAIIEGYPLKKSGAQKIIATSFGLKGQKEYEGAVIKMLKSDQASADAVRQHFFAYLTTDIRAQQ